MTSCPPSSGLELTTVCIQNMQKAVVLKQPGQLLWWTQATYWKPQVCLYLHCTKEATLLYTRCSSLSKGVHINTYIYTTPKQPAVYALPPTSSNHHYNDIHPDLSIHWSRGWHKKLLDNFQCYKVCVHALHFVYVWLSSVHIHLWQSRVEIEHYSVAYFGCGTAFEAL